MLRVLLILLLTVGGCSSDPVLVGEPITVTEEEIDNYWVYDRSRSRLAIGRCVEKHGSGHAVVDMIIDSNGTPHVLEILEMTPDCILSQWPKVMIESSRYAAAPGNEGRTPIHAEKTLEVRWFE